jgi:rubrerythrin
MVWEGWGEINQFFMNKRITQGGINVMEDYTRLKMPDDILNAALIQEKNAYDFYTNMSVRCRIDFVRELIEKLKDEEYKHIQLIEGMLVRLRMG